MRVANIKAESREKGSRQMLKKLRRRGYVPAVVYGHEKTPEIISLELHDLRLALTHMAHVVKVEVNGGEQQYLLKDVQYDHLQSTPIHVDLMRADPNEKVRVKVPVELRGEPAGTHTGGVLVHVMSDLEIECRLLDIPEQIRPKVDHLGLNESLSIKDIELPEGVTAVGDPDEVIATVTAKRGVTAADAAEGGEAEAAEAATAEPEVIGRTAKEESADEG